MKNIFLVLILTLSFSGFSQKKTDSLISALIIVDNYRDKLSTLKKIYWNLVYSYPDSSINYAKNALSISKSAQNDSLIGYSYNIIGIGYDVKSEAENALLYYDSAMIYSTRAEDSSGIAGVHNNIGLIYWNQGNNEKAIEEYLTSEKLYIAIGNEKGLANCYSNIGLIYSELRDYSKSIDYHNRSLSINKILNNEYGENINKLNISQLVLYEQEKFSKEEIEQSATYVMDNIKYFKSQQNLYALGKVYTTRSIYYVNFEEFDSAFYYNELSIDCYRKIGATNLLASSLYNSSFRILEVTNDRRKAIRRVEEAYGMIKETGSMDFSYKLTNHLGNLYSEDGKYYKATQMYQESIRLRDSLFSKEKKELIYDMEAKYESEKKEKEINRQKSLLLEQEKNSAQAELSSLRKQWWIYALVVILFLFGLFTLLFFLRRRKLSEIEKEQAIQLEKEKGLNAVIESQEKERERIAKNIHDGVIQQLVSLKFGMNSLIDNHTKKLIKQLDDATYELRDLSHDLMPKNLERFGLSEALSNLHETSFQHTDILYTYDAHGLKGKLSKEVEINIYRTVQELIHNAIKHSEATKIDTQLYQIEDSLHVIFEDNGKGFKQENNEAGIGIQSINSRIKSLNGTINYESTIDNGTLVTIKVLLDF